MHEEFSEEVEEEKDERDGKSISSDLIRGHINTIILRSLSDGDKYGYEIMAEIERKSHGQYALKQPSLYSALKRLEKEGFITSYWGGSVGGGRRKYFSLTGEGRAISEQNQSEWEYSRTIIDSLISDKEFDFNQPAPSAVNMRVLRNSTSRVPTTGEDSEEDFEFEPAFADSDYERKNEELTVRSAELERERAALEEARGQFEEEIRAREEALRIVNEEKERELVAREEAFRLESEEKERNLAERERILEEESREALLADTGVAEEERAAYNAQLREQRERMEEERERYESVILEQQERISAEQAAHRLELEQQERRIREEQEALFRKREQELIHQNYLNLVNTPPPERKEAGEYNYFNAPVAEEKPEVASAPAPQKSDERGYRSVVREIYESSVTSEHDEAPAPRAKSLDGADFYDIEARAARDGIRLTTVGGKPMQEQSDRSTSVVHKGKALFLAAIVVFFYLVTLGGISLGVLQDQYELPLFYPYFIWGTGVILLLVTGLAYANHFGERALRKKSLALVNAIVIFLLTVIVTLIVALAIPIDFAAAHDYMTFLTIPVLFLFGIVIFGIVYYVQVRPRRK